MKITHTIGLEFGVILLVIALFSAITETPKITNDTRAIISFMSLFFSLSLMGFSVEDK